MGLAPESFILGSDSCLKLGEIAAKRGHNVVACDNQNLPFRDNCFDAVISVGVIHHFASARRRIKALEELYRILQPGGKMLVYVWALEQDERKVSEKFINLNWLILSLCFSIKYHLLNESEVITVNKHNKHTGSNFPHPLVRACFLWVSSSLILKKYLYASFSFSY